MDATLAPPTAPPAAAPAASAALSRRVDAVDLLRGLVMVIMVLDHTRDFFHRDLWAYAPEDLSRAPAAVFLTRWITHFCAPVFVLLAGTGTMLQRQRGATSGELSRFLLTRGLWLIVLEFTLVRLGFLFNVDYSSLGVFQVIWVLGVSMIVLAALVHLPVALVGAFGVAMVAGHNVLDAFDVAQGPAAPTAFQQLWFVLHQPGPVSVFGVPAFVLYPLIPWVGVIAAGYALGSVYAWDAERRQRTLIRLGLALTGAFIVIRAINGYGDPQPWAAHDRGPVFTVLAFLNTAKYPPSLLFLLMTLGPALVALALFERGRRGRVGQALVTLGRVPLFFYLLQWYVPHTLAILAGLAAGQAVGWQFQNFADRFASPPTNVGFGLHVVYVAWIVTLVILYPVCRWYAGVKRTHPRGWMRYL